MFQQRQGNMLPNKWKKTNSGWRIPEAFKDYWSVLELAWLGNYWKGPQKNPLLTRRRKELTIYFFSFGSFFLPVENMRYFMESLAGLGGVNFRMTVWLLAGQEYRRFITAEMSKLKPTSIYYQENTCSGTNWLYDKGTYSIYSSN